MERVKGQQLHLQRVLKKELSDLEHDYRVQEAKRDREIRNLGVDLTKLKKFTKDVDQIFTEDTPKLATRRASLPALSSPRPLTSPAVPAASRQRRLSVVTPPSRSRLELLNASISNSPSPRLSYSPTQLDLKATSGKHSPRRASISSDCADDKGSSVPVRKRSQENPNTTCANFSAPFTGMTHDDDRRESTDAVKMSSQTQSTRRGSKGTIDGQAKVSDSKAPVKNGVRRSSLDGGTKTASQNGKSSIQTHTNGKSTRRGSKTSEPEISHNETKVYVHRDGQEPYLVSKDVSCPSVGSVEDESNLSSIFEGRPPRRASEPALGGHFLRVLQAKASAEEKPEARSHHALTPAEDELRKSIAKDLPSQIVAEEDEDRYNEENAHKTNTEAKCSNATVDEKTPEKERKKSGAKPRSKSGPLARQVQEANGKSDKVKENDTASKTNTRVSVLEIGNSERKQPIKTDKASTVKFSKLQQRRKSDGDVLRFARIWKMQAQNGRHTYKESREEPINDTSGDSTKMSIWDAVRKCRYIRGYNPPEMDEPEDLNEFVFGHPNPDTVIPTK